MSEDVPRPTRRDPRQLRAGLREARAARGVSEQPPIDQHHPHDASFERIEAPCYLVIAVLDLEAGVPSAADRDLLGAARRLADAGGGAVVLAAAVPSREAVRFDPTEFGADRVAWLTHSAFVTARAETRVAAVLALVAATSPRHVLFSETEIGGELGRRVAAHLDEWPATDVIRLSGGTATALQDRGRSEVVRPAPMILILAPRSFDPVSATPRREGRPIEIPVFEASGGTREAGLLPVDPAGIPLREADLIIGAGQGVRDWNSFHAVARALEAAEGGTRVVCDNGHLPRERQIGASGTHVAPRCYLALGISGASQHLAGIVESRHVIAINVDPDCDMVRRADLAVIADAQPVMTALLRYLEGSK